MYQALLEKVTLPISAVPHFRALAALFGVSLETVYSIYSQEVQARVVRTHHVLKQSVPDLARRYLAGAALAGGGGKVIRLPKRLRFAFDNGEHPRQYCQQLETSAAPPRGAAGSAEALQLCYEADLPPCIVMRRLLEALGMGKTKITEALRAPAALPALLGEAEVRALLAGAAGAGRGGEGGAAPRPASAEGAAVDAAAVAAFYARLQADITLCVLCDRVYSPESDAARHAAGVAHEARLYADLRAAGVAFWSEEELRSKGFLKTPDAKLQVGSVGSVGGSSCSRRAR